MKKSVIETARAPRAAGCYSQAIKVGNFVFTAAIAGVEPESGELVSGDIRAQVRQTLKNISAVLEEAGTSLDDAVKVNAYLRDIGDFAAYNEAYSEYFGPHGPPARTTVQVGGFPGNVAVAIDVIAYLPRG